MPRELPSQEDLLLLLEYDQSEGTLRWRKRPLALFSDGGITARHSRDIWNGRFAGKAALTAVRGDGYRHGAIHGVYYISHRVIWKMMTGEDPIEIDHIDGDRKNNRWNNLRNIPSKLNKRNAARHADNRSGVTGVRRTNRGGWQAFITVDYKMICIGSSNSFDEAVKMRKDAEVKYGFHANHGREAVT